MSPLQFIYATKVQQKLMNTNKWPIFNVVVRIISIICILIVSVNESFFYLGVYKYPFLEWLYSPIFIFVFFFWIRRLFVEKVNDLFFLVPLLVVSQFLMSSYSFNKSYENEGECVFTLVNYNINQIYSLETKGNESLTKYLKFLNSDVVCLQEAVVESLDSNVNLHQIGQGEYLFSFLHQGTKSINAIEFGLAIYSKYPIINSGKIFDRMGLNQVIYSDIDFQGGVIRVYNCHLQSNHLFKKDFSNIFNLFGKLIKSAVTRNMEINHLLESVKSCPHPYIVCGDFNGVPLSMGYRRISEVLKDAHLCSGNGYGSTFHHDFLPSLRIDYQFYSESISVKSQEVIYQVDDSDHYPLKGSYFLKRSAD